MSIRFVIFVFYKLFMFGGTEEAGGGGGPGAGEGVGGGPGAGATS